MKSIVPLELTYDVAGRPPVWFDGPPVTTTQLGARGYSYGPNVRNRDPYVIAATHILIIFLREARFSMWLAGERTSATVGPSIVTSIRGSEAMTANWDRPVDVFHVYIAPEHLDAVARAAHDDPSHRTKLVASAGLRDPILYDLIVDVMDEMRRPGIGHALALQATSDRLLLHLVRHHCVSADDAITDTALEPRLRSAITDIVAHLDAPLRIEALARDLDLSVNQLIRVFRSRLGCTPQAFIREQRLIRARELLTDGVHSVADVAAQTGFADQSHLSRHFRKRFGETPSGWKRRRS